MNESHHVSQQSQRSLFVWKRGQCILFVLAQFKVISHGANSILKYPRYTSTLGRTISDTTSLCMCKLCGKKVGRY